MDGSISVPAAAPAVAAQPAVVPAPVTFDPAVILKLQSDMADMQKQITEKDNQLALGQAEAIAGKVMSRLQPIEAIKNNKLITNMLAESQQAIQANIVHTIGQLMTEMNMTREQALETLRQMDSKVAALLPVELNPSSLPSDADVAVVKDLYTKRTDAMEQAYQTIASEIGKEGGKNAAGGFMRIGEVSANLMRLQDAEHQKNAMELIVQRYQQTEQANKVARAQPAVFGGGGQSSTQARLDAAKQATVASMASNPTAEALRQQQAAQLMQMAKSRPGMMPGFYQPPPPMMYTGVPANPTQQQPVAQPAQQQVPMQGGFYGTPVMYPGGAPGFFYAPPQMMPQQQGSIPPAFAHIPPASMQVASVSANENEMKAKMDALQAKMCEQARGTDFYRVMTGDNVKQTGSFGHLGEQSGSIPGWPQLQTGQAPLPYN